MTVTGAQTTTGEAEEQTADQVVDDRQEATGSAEMDAERVHGVAEVPVTAEPREDDEAGEADEALGVDDGGQIDEPDPVDEDQEAMGSAEVDAERVHGVAEVPVTAADDGVDEDDEDPEDDGALGVDDGGQIDEPNPVGEDGAAVELGEPVEIDGLDRSGTSGGPDPTPASAGDRADGHPEAADDDGGFEAEDGFGIDGGFAEDAVAADDRPPNGTIELGDDFDDGGSPLDAWSDPLDEEANESIPVEAWLERAVAIYDRSKLEESMVDRDAVTTVLPPPAIAADPDTDVLVVPMDTEPVLDWNGGTVDGMVNGDDGRVFDSTFAGGDRPDAGLVADEGVDETDVELEQVVDGWVDETGVEPEQVVDGWVDETGVEPEQVVDGDVVETDVEPELVTDGGIDETEIESEHTIDDEVDESDIDPDPIVDGGGGAVGIALDPITDGGIDEADVEGSAVVDGWVGGMEIETEPVTESEVASADVEASAVVDDERFSDHGSAGNGEVADVEEISPVAPAPDGVAAVPTVAEETRPVERGPVVAAPGQQLAVEDQPTPESSAVSTTPAVQPPQRHRFIASALLFAGFLICLGGAAGYVLANYLPERWTAEAEVILDPGTAQADRYLDTQTVLLESSTVLDRALVDLPIEREELEDGLEVFPIEASTALAINYVDEDPALARTVVATVLDAFMTEVERDTASTTRPIYEARIAELTTRRDELERQLDRLETANAEAEASELAPPYPAEVRRMSLESERLLAQVGQLTETMLADEVAAVTRIEAVVVTEPRLLAEPTWPKPLAFSALGLLVGSVVAAAALFLIVSRRAG